MVCVMQFIKAADPGFSEQGHKHSYTQFVFILLWVFDKTNSCYFLLNISGYFILNHDKISDFCAMQQIFGTFSIHIFYVLLLTVFLKHVPHGPEPI